ncbi:chromobox protein homolog 3-like [Perognathus longimembris pacificus]|uniref:chromobox protein homolog 3-like n=1 Tax=Perognathus longimembris pacificus TaxID=214514 RepID=UPI00201A0A45|nr:chromobox protein homolog 3-like [Perognathus longimembris pacificus]
MTSKETTVPKGRKKQNRKSERVEEAELEELEVEKIVGQRVVAGQVEYLVKWKGYSDADNTWEWEESLNCSELMEVFLNSQKPGLSDSEFNNSTSENKRDAGDSPTGFARGLEPEQIIAVTENREGLMFLMKWKELDKAELVPAKEANVMCPQIVIAFYEGRIIWDSEDEDQ